MSKELPDTQSKPYVTSQELYKVGIRNVRVPLTLLQRDGDKVQNSIATISSYVDLRKPVAGISMSRIVEVIQDTIKKYPVSKDFLKEALYKLKERLETNDAYIKLRFHYGRLVGAPKTHRTGWKYYDTIIEGELKNDEFNVYLTVIVPFISTCRCSKELALHLEETTGVRGTPHQQRAVAKVSVTYDPNIDIVWIEDIIDLVENKLKTLPYTLIKRLDEQEIGRLTWKYTHFVETASRDIAEELNKEEKIKDWTVVVESEESIHLHNAVSITWKKTDHRL